MTSATDRGDRFDSSIGRGDFKTKIGVGQVIRGELSLSMSSIDAIY